MSYCKSATGNVTLRRVYYNKSLSMRVCLYVTLTFSSFRNSRMCKHEPGIHPSSRDSYVELTPSLLLLCFHQRRAAVGVTVHFWLLSSPNFHQRRAAVGVTVHFWLLSLPNLPDITYLLIVCVYACTYLLIVCVYVCTGVYMYINKCVQVLKEDRIWSYRLLWGTRCKC